MPIPPLKLHNAINDASRIIYDFRSQQTKSRPHHEKSQPFQRRCGRVAVYCRDGTIVTRIDRLQIAPSFHTPNFPKENAVGPDAQRCIK